MWVLTIAIPEDMEVDQDGGMLRLTFDKAYSLFEVSDQFKSLETALLVAMGYGGEVTE